MDKFVEDLDTKILTRIIKLKSIILKN